ncbi:MAG: GNAT family N-acetyltransferase [Candidatus Omnitrophica bacterium]|nr:GNAT family N-acetyltransferase [Candidatus Omnitrophota bacterium]
MEKDKFNITEAVVRRADAGDQEYINEKLEKYLLDREDPDWRNFYVVKYKDRTVGFGRIIDHGAYLELASIGVDYYFRGKDIGTRLTRFLVKEAKKTAPGKEVYLVTHIPGYFRRAGFKEIKGPGPEELEYKRHNKCKLDASRIKIMKLS